MPDLINPTFDTKIDQPDIPVVVDTQWNRPTVQIPDSLKQSQALFQEPGDVSLMDFTNKVNNHLTPDQVKRNNEDANIMASLTPKITTPSKEVPFRYFSSIDAMRYKQNSRLWNTQGYNPEVPSDITDAIYDFHETKWESIKNILPKLWSTTAFSFKNYFAEYADTARAISQLDANLLHDSQRFEDYQNDQNELEALNPDYKTDKEVKWWQLGRGDYWEQSASSLGFTIGTIAAAVTENVGITLATGGLGEFGELYNSPRKIYKAISDYYSLKRAYSLVKGALGAKSLVGRLGNAANIWRLTNGALSEAAFEGATIAYDYLQSYKQNYIDKYGRNPSEEEMKGAKMAANSMANATILFETPFLMASNAVQFGNLIAPKTIGKLAKLGEKGAFKLGTELIDGLPKTIVQSTENQAKNIFTKYGEKGLHAIKNATWEGTEESYQALVTTSTQKYYGDKYKNGDDGDIMKALGAGYDYITSNQGLIEFSAGFATGEIFHLAGVPLHIFAKPSVRTAEEQATYKKANPDATDIDAKYKTNVLNNVFGYGMDKINKEREKANLEEIAKKLNSVDLEKFLKEEGFLSLVKDKQTQFALAKYLQNNDQFNMQNAQNLQLNRYLYAGLTTGKIDLQIDKLKQFASQDFHTLSEFFGLDENDYSTQEDKDKFINGFRAWTAELGNKTKEFERIFNQQKDSFSSIISAAAKEHDKNLSIKNSFLTDLQRKYSEDNIENLSKKISSDEITQLNDMNVATVASHFRFYAVNEAVKASVFSQVGMDDAANRAKDIVRQLVKNDSTHTFYHELGSFFDIGYRENRLKDLQSKVDLAKSSNDENLSLYEQQLNSFKSMTKKLDGQFNRASNYNIDSVANSILDYLHNTQRELNNLDNSTSLEDRIANQEVGQYSLLKEFVKLQKSHQENLNLYNYLSSQANREDYTRFQSRKLTDFFSKAVELTDNEEKDKQVKEAVDNNGVQEAEVVKSYVKKTEEPIQVSNTLSENTKVESKPKYNIDNVNALILAIIQKNFQKISDLKSEIAKIPKDLVEERVNLLISRVATYKKPENANKIKEEFRRIFGEDFLQNSPTPKVEEKPAVKQPSTNPLDKIKITLTPQEDKKADIERRRQEELEYWQAEDRQKRIKEGRETTKKVLENLKKKYPATTFQGIVIRLLEKIIDFNTFAIINSEGLRLPGGQDATKFGALATGEGMAMRQDRIDALLAGDVNAVKTFIHELVHTFTKEKVGEYQMEKSGLIPGYKAKLTEKEKQAVAELERIYNKVKAQFPSSTEYGLTNLDEFLAEAFSNDSFQRTLKEIKAEGKKTSLFKEWLNAVVDLFYAGLEKWAKRFNKEIPNKSEVSGILEDVMAWTEDLIDDKLIKLEVTTEEINAKYDAELATLEETSGVSGSALKDVEGKKADIEIGKVGNTEYEVKVDGVYYQGKKLNNPENKTHRQLIKTDIERRRQEELNQKTDAGYSIIALDYLFTGGRDVIQSTDYLLQALVGGFTSAAKEINDIRNKYADKLGNIKDDINSDVYNQMMLEIRDVINKNYNDPKANEIFDKILKNATGFTTREGNQTSIELDKLNEQNDSKINAKYYAELAALGATTTTSIKPGVEELFDENPELANAVYEALGFKTKTSENEITRGIKEILPFKVIGDYSNIEEGLTGRSQYSTTINGNNYVFDISTYSYENEDGTFESYFDIDFTVNGSEDIVGTGFFDKSEKAKQIIQALISQNYGNNTIRFNVEESKKGKQRLLLYKRLMNQLGYNPSGEMEYALFYDIKRDKVNLTPQQKQQAQQLYSQYLDTIFPDSKVKDIVYHGTNLKFDKFDKKRIGSNTAVKGEKPSFSFTTNKNQAEAYTSEITVGENTNDLAERWFSDNEQIFKNGDISTGIIDINNVKQHYKKELLGETEMISPLNEIDSKTGKYKLVPINDKNLQTLAEIKTKEFQEEFDTLMTRGINIINALLDIKNPKVIDFKGEKKNQKFKDEQKSTEGDSFIAKNVDDWGVGDVIQVFEPEQTHILGSKQDIEGFKTFVDKINAKYDAELAALDKEEKKPVGKELTKEEKNFIDSIKGLDTSKLGVFKVLVDTLNDPDSTIEDKQQTIKELAEQLADKRSEESLGSALGQKASDALYNYIDKNNIKVEPVVIKSEPQEFDETIPPTTPKRQEVVGYGPIGENLISILIDKARESGLFTFDSTNPEEIDKIEDDHMILKTASDPLALRHHMIMEKLDSIFAKDTTDKDNFKVKLEFINDNNKDWFYKKDDRKRNEEAIIAVIVDNDGNYHYFDKMGNLTTKELGSPFAVEYRDLFYTSEYLTSSRNNLGDKTLTTITPNYKGDKHPLSKIYTLIGNNIPVYGSIKGITAGVLSSLNATNSFNNTTKSSYKTRPLQELFDKGELDEQLISVKVDKGFYLDYSPTSDNQMIKVGRPTVIDYKTGLSIPLIGRKVKDLTFNGQKIDKSSQMYEVIDWLDKKGKISLDSLRPDKTRIIATLDDIDNIYHFLRELLYSKLFYVSQSSPDTIEIKRNMNKDKSAVSLWDAEINYVDKRGPLISIPFTSAIDESGNTVGGKMDYEDFLRENFETGAIQATISSNDKRFTKLNKRVIFGLDDSYSDMLNKLDNKTIRTEDIKVGDRFSPNKDLSRQYEVIEVDEDRITLHDEVNDEDKSINAKDLVKSWQKVEKIVEPEPIVYNDSQKATIKKIKELSVPKEKSTYRVTTLARPSQVKKTSGSSSTVMGNVIDYIAKNIFSGNKVTAEDDISMLDQNGSKITGKLGSYFLGKTNLEDTISKLVSIKESLEKEYAFVSGVRVRDEETNTGGEIDLVLINNKGEAIIADFKTAGQLFDDAHLEQHYNTGVTDKEYFATQAYLYGLMLEKQTGIKVLSEKIVIGLPISFSEGKNNIYESKIKEIKKKDNYIVSLSDANISGYYKVDNKPFTSVKKIVDKYNEVIKQNAITPEEGLDALTGKKKRGKPLEMNIKGIMGIAASNEALQRAIDHMSSMFGEEFIVTFSNTMNKFKYGEWTTNGTILYKNAIIDTPYHEGWHQFSQLFLTRAEKLKMYKSLRDQAISYIDRDGEKRNTSDHYDLEIEEFLADEWVKYVKSPSSYKFPGKYKGILGFFRDLWRLIKNFFSSTHSPEILFKDLYNGNLTNYTKDINNSLWGNLTSSILDSEGNEILNHVRTNLYIQTTSYFIGEVLRENNKSFSWLRQNSKNEYIKDNIFDKFVDLQADRLSKLSQESNLLHKVLTDPDSVLQKTVKEKNIPEQEVTRYIAQIQEIENLLADENNAFNRFYDYYLKNSDIDTLREGNDREEILDPLDTEEIREILEEDGETEAQEYDEDTPYQKGYNEGPNEKNPFTKASKEVQDFHRTMPIVIGYDEDNNPTYLTNELGIPLTYDYASIFNMTKSILSGKDNIEDIIAKLSDPYVIKVFPQARYIKEKLQEYITNTTPENFSFLQRYVKIMGMPEVDNKKLTVNEDAFKYEGLDKTLVKVRSLSRTGEISDINQWTYQFKRPSDEREAIKLDDTLSPYDIFSSNNILFNVEGQLWLNPFVDYSVIKANMTSKKFLSLMGIELNDTFWDNPYSTPFADKVVSYLLNDLITYREYLGSLLQRDKGSMSDEELDEFLVSKNPNPMAVKAIIKDYFINNPIQQFRERKTYKYGDKILETFSIHTLLEDLSRQNSLYSLNAPSRSFTDGGGKTKWPYYEPSLITRRTQLLNNIENIGQFDNNLEMLSLNPNKNPWLKNTLFYKVMFDSEGNRAYVSKKNKTGIYDDEKIRIDLADLSCYENISEGFYTRKHPKDLSAVDKLFFDTVTLITDGWLEVPRAATSSSIFAIKLNSYNSVPKGTGVVSQYLPINVTSSAVFSGERFRGIMRGYLTGELQKLKWYFDNNPNAEDLSKKMDDPSRNYFAHNLNVFKDILSPELAKTLIEATQNMSGKNKYDNIKQLVEDNKDAFHTDLSKYFVKYVADLMNSKENANYNAMSNKQKKVLRNILSLYQDKSKSQDIQDVERDKQIASILQETGGKSSALSSKESAKGKIDSAMNIVAAIFATNQFILNIEYHNWYMGDNYLFANPFKRGNLTTNTGTMAIVSPHVNEILNSLKENTMHYIYTGNKEGRDYRILNTIPLKEMVVESKYYDMMINDVINWEKMFNPFLNISNRKIELEKAYSAYKDIKAADGQAKIGLDAYRRLRIIYGNWDNSTDEKEYMRQLAILRVRKNLYFDEKRNPLTADAREEAIKRDQKLIDAGPHSSFNPQKFAYTGPEIIKDSKGNPISAPMRTKFDKTSLHPLLPEVLAGSGLGDEHLMNEMAKNDIDYAKFESASKGVKHNDIVDFYTEEGMAQPNIKLEDHTPEFLLSSFLKNQLSTDGMYTENTFGSQQRVMFFDVIYQAEVQGNPALLKKLTSLQNKFLQSVNNIMDYQRAQFLNRFGMEESGSGQSYKVDIIDNERFAAAVNSLAKTNNFPDNMMEYLKFDPSTSTYTFDPSLVFNRKVLIDTIGGLLDGELRRLKTKGAAAIQVTSGGNTYNRFTNPTEEQIKKFGTNGLHYYHIKNDDKGNPLRISTMGVKLTLQGDFKNLLNLNWNGKQIKTLKNLNRALADEAWKNQHIDKLTFVSYRIPTNNNNFIDHVEIMEFLPESAGNIIIAPPEHIIKTGSDFDVDKSNLIFPSIDSKGNLVSLPTRSIKEIQEEINKITYSQKDYKKLQRDIRNDLANIKSRHDKAENKWNKLQNTLRDIYFNIDGTGYSGLVSAGKTIYEINKEFENSLDEGSAKLLAQFEKLDESLKDAGYITYPKIDHNFESLFRELTSYKDYYTNEMLSSMKETLQDPAYFRMLTTPSNADYLLDEAKKIGELTGRKTKDGLSSSDNTKQTTVNTKGEEYLGANIGPYSIQRRWFSLLNFSKMELNRQWSYKTAAKEYAMRIVTPLAGNVNEREQLGTNENIRMYGDNLDGISPRDLWDQMMTLTIDLPSNTSYVLFGINNSNKKVVQYLMASRYSFPKIMKFINQPVLQEVYKLYDKRSKELPTYSLKNALVEVSKKYDVTEGNFIDLQDKNIIKDTEGNEISGNAYLQNPGVFASKLLNDDITFSEDDMKEDIINPLRTKDFIQRQKNILLYFMTAHLEASQFTSMQFAFSEDRNKNTNYFTIRENDKAKDRIRGNEDDISENDSMFSKQALIKLEKQSIYAPFTYSKIAKLFYRQYAKEFTNLDVSLPIEKLLAQTNTWGIDKQLLATRIEGDFIEFIYKNFAQFDIDIYNPYSDKIERSDKKFSDFFMQNIFNTEVDPEFRSYSDKLIKFLEKYPELNHIQFVQKIYPEGQPAREVNENSNPLDKYSSSTIRFRRSQDNTITERNHFSNELENLMVFNPELFQLKERYTEQDRKNISSFFTELAYLTLYQSGPTNIADNFSDLLPANFWKDFSGKAFENYHKAITDGTVTHKTLMKLFSMLYTENNPKVPWKSAKMVYDIRYYGEQLSTEVKQSMYRNKKIYKFTNYFLNFRAGKMYDFNRFIKNNQFLGIKDIKC